jgi:hypothetical protein
LTATKTRNGDAIATHDASDANPMVAWRPVWPAERRMGGAGDPGFVVSCFRG